MKGKCIGVGIGPGDSELITIKGYKLLNSIEVIAFPGKVVEETLAYEIVSPIIDNINNKTLLPIYMPMTKDKKVLEENHKKGAEKIKEFLDKGHNVAFVVLGDTTVYSTFLYIQKYLKEDSYETEIIPGITSFCAASAVLNEGLVEGKEPLHIYPATYNLIPDQTDGTMVFMKSGKKILELCEVLDEKDIEYTIVENATMKNQRIFTKENPLKEQSSYYSLVIGRSKKK